MPSVEVLPIRIAPGERAPVGAGVATALPDGSTGGHAVLTGSGKGSED
ncbi:hypothetical protein UO65_3087 [Actinokineospora spheciospongiae]|uniref:Uncharacterized protein n=1 Tax=Actinokineospora spheciospongiae TaxID=909613 RepID=W7J6Q2_9PSEU|nr:hypothetical protein [Actinokineospora spheciospongiae]EWC61729.1 hypothetical protein UO65_3087 [Actinokineospora spheciospongiae]PWW62211.1 hypothetical protein DFQ13_10521 [Actinokineospora spheciospongiae]